MRTNRSRLGLSILAGAVSFVGAASGSDLIVNGSFEDTSGTGWKYYGTYNYTPAYYIGAPVPSSENPGSVFSWNHASANGAYGNFVTPTNELDHLQYNLIYADSQTVSLTNAITGAAVDSGLGRFSFSSWLASYGQPSSNPEQPYVVLRFWDGTGTNQAGDNVIFDRTGNVHAIMFADGTTDVPADVSADHQWIKYGYAGTVPTGARSATVYITRSPNAGLTGRPDTYVDLVKLDVFNVNDTTSLDSASPANNQAGVAPDAVVKVTLKDINTQVNPNSIQLTFDGTAVTPTIQKSGVLTTIQYDPPGLLAPMSSHQYKIVWSDTGATVTTKTNQVAFQVVAYANVDLGTPLYQETFDSLAEGALPTGWTVANFTDPDSVPGIDYSNFHSDAFVDWTVISRSTLSNWFSVTPGGSDFNAIFNVMPNQAIDQALVTNLISGNFIIAVSDRASGQKQIDYLYTRDYNLSGKANVYLSFHNIYVQNQNNIASVEYSIDGGTTWLPALYLLDTPDILTDANGNIDASNTFATVYADVPNIEASTTGGGYYGQFIGVKSNLWSTLAPYLSARLNDDQTASKRVEVIRLAQADNQPAVRVRFAYAATYAWYFAMDDFGLYSLSNVSLPVLASGPTPTNVTVAAGNSLTLTMSTALGVGPMSYQWRLNGVNIAGKTSQSLVIPVVKPSDNGNYDVVVSNPAGSVTSPASVVSVINPAVFVTGQWDFNNGLAATLGQDLAYFDATVQGDTTFGTTTSFGIADINGVSAPVMHFLPSAARWGGYVCPHGAAPNGGGSYVNEYTLIYDLYYPGGSDRVWRTLWQTDVNDANDGDLFINTANGIGISSVYSGNVTADTWHRVAVAFDLTGPGAPVLTKFIDGVKVGSQTTGLSAKDGRFSLGPQALLFGDNDGDVAEAYVSSFQFSNGRRPDAYLAALGGPSAAKIPGAIKATVENGRPVIRWTGGVPLQSAASINGPWVVVVGATSPYTPPAGEAAKFYRPQVP